MAKYLLTKPAFVGGAYYAADVRQPLVVEFPDSLQPSREWEPLDGAASAALKKHVDVDRKVNAQRAKAVAAAEELGAVGQFAGPEAQRRLAERAASQQAALGDLAQQTGYTQEELEAGAASPKRKVGRPFGSKNKPQPTEEGEETDEEAPTGRRPSDTEPG